MHAGRSGNASVGILDHRETWAADNLLSRGQEIAVAVDLDKVVDVVLRPGEMSLHHVKIAHNSEPNRSDSSSHRVRYSRLAAHVKQSGGARDMAMLVRGTDSWNFFDREDGAVGEFLPADLERHARSWAGTRLVPEAPARAM